MFGKQFTLKTEHNFTYYVGLKKISVSVKLLF